VNRFQSPPPRRCIVAEFPSKNKVMPPMDVRNNLYVYPQHVNVSMRNNARNVGVMIELRDHDSPSKPALQVCVCVCVCVASGKGAMCSVYFFIFQKWLWLYYVYVCVIGFFLCQAIYGRSKEAAMCFSARTGVTWHAQNAVFWWVCVYFYIIGAILIFFVSQ